MDFTEKVFASIDKIVDELALLGITIEQLNIPRSYSNVKMMRIGPISKTPPKETIYITQHNDILIKWVDELEVE